MRYAWAVIRYRVAHFLWSHSGPDVVDSSQGMWEFENQLEAWFDEEPIWEDYYVERGGRKEDS